MVRVLFLVLMGSFWILSGAEAHYIINLEMTTEPRIVRPENQRESLFLDDTLNVRIVSEIAVVAKVQILLCYVGEERPSYYFASFLVNSKTEKNNYILDYNLTIEKGMQGIWYCTILFDRDPILFELQVLVTSPTEVSSQAEIANETGFYSKIVTPTNIETTSNTNRHIYGYGAASQNKRYRRNSKRSNPEPGSYAYDAESQVNETTSNTNKHNYGYGAEPQNTYYGTNSKRNNPESGAYSYNAEPQVDEPAVNTNKHYYGYGLEPQNTRYGTNSKRNNTESGPYGYGAEPQINETTSNTNTNKRYYDYGAAATQNTHFDYGTEPQNTRFNATTRNPKNDGPHPYVDAKNNDESAVNIKMYVFIAIAAVSGILIGTIVGVLYRKRCKAPDTEPIVSFTTADPVYDDVSLYTKSNVANRPPHPLPFEEREENKQYIHYDTPYDHRCGWKPPQRVVTFSSSIR